MLQTVILDGGMGTSLTDNGHSEIDQDPLWSAKLLLTKPEAIQKVHQDFLDSGTQLLGANTYQIPPDHEKAPQMVKTAFSITQKITSSTSTKIAASIGPYGAILHDGSEYNGNYVDVPENLPKIKNYFTEKLNLIEVENPDIYAFETVPALQEVKIIHNVMENKNSKYYVSVQATKELKMGHGECLSEFIENSLQNKLKNQNFTAFGLNCVHSDVPVKFVQKYLDHLKAHKGPILSIILYPNNNMIWCGKTHTWTKAEQNDLNWVDEVISTIKSSDIYKSGRLDENSGFNPFRQYRPKFGRLSINSFFNNLA